MDTIHDEGWIKLHRKILDNPIFKDSEALQLFIYCLLKATHKPMELLVNQQVVNLERGQLIFGLHRAHKDLKMSIRKLRTRLLILQTIGILTRKTTNRFSIITVCNYNQYQDSKIEKGQAERQADDKQTTTNKKIKNLKNLKNLRNNNNGRSQKKETDPRVKEYLDFWAETFLQETGSPYSFSWGREGKLAKDLLKVHSLETLQDAAKRFFKDDEAKRRGFDIGTFKLMLNRIVSKKAMDPLEEAKKDLGMRDL